VSNAEPRNGFLEGDWLRFGSNAFHFARTSQVELTIHCPVVAMLASTAPTTKEGIEKYLGSGMVKGIGPVYAKKLVATFGERIFDIIEQESARLEDVDGIGPKRRKQMKAAWAEQKVIREIMVFPHSKQVSN